jgi:hypothetical protein
MDKVYKNLEKYKSDKFNPKLFEYENFLSLKFNLSSKLNIKCFKYDDFDVIKIYKSKVYFDKEIIQNNIQKCNILPLYIYDKDNTHMISVIVDKSKKTVSLFTNNQNNKFFYKKIIEQFNLNYKIIIDNVNIKCDSYQTLCVPLSLLMIYCYFNNIELNKFIQYINKLSIKSSYYLLDNFLNYLEN